MYFLSAALSGMKRRLLATSLTIFGGMALLTASVSVGLWSLWLQEQKEHMRAMRSASVFVESVDNSVVEEVLTRVMQVRGVESARLVSSQEFQSFLKEHFPDLHAALATLGDDVIPRMLEVTFPPQENTFRRRETVSALSAIPNVARVDDGADRLTKALDSLRWLSYGGLALCLGLWLVLFIVCLGHYQNIIYTDYQEILLVRSFGATKLAIFMPWLIEALLQSAITGTACAIVLFVGRAYLAAVYNEFFGTIGYEPFMLDWARASLAALAMFAMASAAHLLAGLTVLVRGKVA